MISVPALPFSDAKHCNRSLKRLQPLPQTFAAQMYPLGAFPDMAGLSRAYGILCPMVFAWMAGGVTLRLSFVSADSCQPGGTVCM